MPQTPPYVDRARGMLLGLAVGDALGAPLEFCRRDQRQKVVDMVGGGPHRLTPGQWTDDTAMALAVADWVIYDHPARPETLMKRFAEWRDDGAYSCTGTCFDIGRTTSGAISYFLETDVGLAGPTGDDTAGNGSIMRLAPTVIPCRLSETQAVELARLQGMTTHRAHAADSSCEVLARILHRNLHRQPGAAAVLTLGDERVHPVLVPIARGDYQRKRRARIRSSGYAVDTLEAALWATASTDTFEDAVVLAVNLGGDADTVGAVTGQIAGAVYGASGIPERWGDVLAWKAQIERYAEELIDAEPVFRFASGRRAKWLSRLRRRFAPIVRS